MSARPVGASNRADLFSSRSDNNGNEFSNAHVDETVNTGRIREDYKLNNEESNDPLQLEHMLGYAGNYHGTVLMLPKHENVYVKSLGKLVSIENLSDAHGQRFLRGHDNEVCALDVSHDGTMIASGQLGTQTYKGKAAPIFLWSARTGNKLAVLRGLTERVMLCKFSTDDKMLCGCGEDQLLYVWDIATGEVIYGQKFSVPASVLVWVEHKRVGHFYSYELAIGVGPNLNRALFDYDPMRVQWSMKLSAYQVPPMGVLIRSFNCIDVSVDKVFVYLGTSAGEILVYRRDTVVFRACVPVCTNGLNDIVNCSDGSLICGGGDGTLTKVIGNDMKWVISDQVRLDSMIKSVSIAANDTELIVACSSGNLYRCLTSTLTNTIAAVSHSSGITCIAFGKSLQYIASAKQSNSPYFFATATKTGEIRVWDLTDYGCLSVTKFPKSGAVLCMCLVDNNTIISGWQDGSIKCIDSTGKMLWFIPSAHRDGAMTIAAHVDNTTQYFVTGGADGAVRVWKYTNRELITQYTEHRKSVVKVTIDEKSPNIVHSVGMDSSVLSFDLKAAKRIICHIVNTGNMTCMTQRKDNENELITSDTLGRLLYWDIDYRDPVIAIQDPARCVIRCCEVSPSGRYLAFAGDDEILKVLDIHAQQIVSLGWSHSSPILSLSWTPDERQIVTGGEDSGLAIWNYFLGGV